MATYEEQLTHLYDGLADIQASLIKLAYIADVYASQDALQVQLNSLAARIDTLTTDVATLQAMMSDLIIELRKK